MPENAILFERGGPNPEVWLEARGFRRSGARSGGLDAEARKVTLPEGAHLLRLHDGRTPTGTWWFTPFEYAAVAAHFELSGEAMLAGRSEGRSLLHSVLYALYGEGDVGTGQDRRAGGAARTVTLPGAPIMREGRQSAVRQVYLPGLAACRASFTLLEEGGLTDAGLHARALALATRRLPFE